MFLTLLHPQHQGQIQPETADLPLEGPCIALGPLRAGYPPLVLGHRIPAQLGAVGDGINGHTAGKQGMGGRGPRHVFIAGSVQPCITR
jgi:hypothetical protein